VASNPITDSGAIKLERAIDCPQNERGGGWTGETRSGRVQSA
jgi:hypothetical protein